MTKNEIRARCTEMSLMLETQRNELILAAGRTVIDLRKGLMTAKLYRLGYFDGTEKICADV